MDRWAIIRRRAADVLAKYERRTGRPPSDLHAGSHAHLKEIARELYQLSVVPDDDSRRTCPVACTWTMV